MTAALGVRVVTDVGLLIMFEAARVLVLKFPMMQWPIFCVAFVHCVIYVVVWRVSSQWTWQKSLFWVGSKVDMVLVTSKPRESGVLAVLSASLDRLAYPIG